MPNSGSKSAKRTASEQPLHNILERAADALGYPVVLKAMGFAHKSEANAARLKVGNLKDAASLAAAVQICRCRRTVGLSKNMVTRSESLELLLVGVVRDPAHGFVLTLAAGGVLTEAACKISVSLILPVTEKDALHSALASASKSPASLAGYRGKPSG